MRKASAIIFCTGLLLVSSCIMDKPKPEELLPGRWVVADATRNGKPTPTLTDLFFEFIPNDSLFTNISGAEEGMRYMVENNTIQQRNGPFDADFEILSITEKEMVVTTTLNGSEFQIRFSKQK